MVFMAPSFRLVPQRLIYLLRPVSDCKYYQNYLWSYLFQSLDQHIFQQQHQTIDINPTRSMDQYHSIYVFLFDYQINQSSYFDQSTAPHDFCLRLERICGTLISFQLPDLPTNKLLLLRFVCNFYNSLKEKYWISCGYRIKE